MNSVRTWAAALLVAGCVAAVVVAMRKGRGPEAAPAEGPVARSEAPAKPNVASTEAPEPAKTAPRPRGIQVCSLEVGSKTDPAAPRYPLGDYESKRAAELKKWQETKVSIQHDEISLQQLMAELGTRWGLKIGLDPEVPKDINLSVNMPDMDATKMMSLLTGMWDLCWVVDGNGDSWLVPEEKKALYDPKEGQSLGSIESLQAQVLADRTPGAEDPRDAAVLKALEDHRDGLSLNDVPLTHVMRMISEYGNLKIEVDALTVLDPANLKMTFDATGKSYREALDNALEPVGLGWLIEGGKVVVTTKDDLAKRQLDGIAASDTRKKRNAEEADFFSRTVVLTGDDLAIRDVAERISKALGVGYTIDPATWSRAARYGFDGEPRTLREIFAALAKGAPVSVAYRQGQLWYVSTGGGK